MLFRHRFASTLGCSGLLFLFASVTPAQTSKTSAFPTQSWIVTSMTAIDNGSSYLLVDWTSKSILEFRKDDVRSAVNGQAQVRSGARLASVRALKGKAGAPGVEMKAMASEGKHSQCVGLVELCCGSGRALRACLGGWDCGHAETTCDH